MEPILDYGLYLLHNYYDAWKMNNQVKIWINPWITNEGICGFDLTFICRNKKYTFSLHDTNVISDAYRKKNKIEFYYGYSTEYNLIWSIQ